MTRTTHLASGALLASAAALAAGAELSPAGLAAAAAVPAASAAVVGAVFPDADFHPPLRSLLGHRTLLHWFPLYAALFFAGLLAGPLWLPWFALGGLLHLGLDALTVSGVPGWRNPWGRCVGPRLVTTGSLTDRLLGGLMALALSGVILAKGAGL